MTAVENQPPHGLDSQSDVDLASTIRDALERLRSTFQAGTTRSLDWRERQLDGIIAFANDFEDELTEALGMDLGRPRLEAHLADIGPSITEAAYIKKRFRKWAKPRRTRLPLNMMPGSARIIPEPLGVCLVIAPWNYPVNLVLEPMAAAFAAGNAVVLKPSELSPATTGVIVRELGRYLDPDAFAVFPGGPEVSTALLEERFDHIFFTGSTAVGRIVMRAAAEHLTPVTLELGGKSPVVVAEDADIEVTANRIAFGKGLNAGQTCIAPDYVLTTAANRDELVDALISAWTTFYGDDIASSPDYCRIINDRHHRRLVALLDGQQIAFGGGHDAQTRFLAPTLIVDPEPDSAVMSEEIFGPILPIVTVADVDEAMRFVNARPKPLALYAFTSSDETADRILAGTSSGGGCVNHTLLHFAPPELPFGGVGASGIGRYHGKAGFDELSNLRGVLRKPVLGEHNLLYPPYTQQKEKLLRRVT